MLMLKMLLGPEADNSTVLGAIDADAVEHYVSKPGHFKVGGSEGCEQVSVTYEMACVAWPHCKMIGT